MSGTALLGRLFSYNKKRAKRRAALATISHSQQCPGLYICVIFWPLVRVRRLRSSLRRLLVHRAEPARIAASKLRWVARGKIRQAEQARTGLLLRFLLLIFIALGRYRLSLCSRRVESCPSVGMHAVDMRGYHPILSKSSPHGRIETVVNRYRQTHDLSGAKQTKRRSGDSAKLLVGPASCNSAQCNVHSNFSEALTSLVPGPRAVRARLQILKIASSVRSTEDV